MTHPTKPAFESKNIFSANISAIAQLFPSCITESRGEDGKLKQTVDFEKLRTILGSDIAQGDESYDFTWVGKKAAMQEAGIPVRKTLRPCTEESRDWDTTQNLYIEGDNLDVLKLLQESYLKKVKMIYIDPPYNTGNDFIYNDHFETDKNEYDEGTGAVDDSGIKNFQQNNDANPRFHSDWCSMIYPRLVLARNLLTDDGVIFISIDENEVINLRKICDEIFGSSNFIAQIVWEKRYTRSNNAKMFASLTDYILLYRKGSDLSVLRESRNEKNDSIYSNPDNDPRGVWTSVSYVNPATKTERPNLCYEIVNPITGKKVNHPTNAWKYEKATYENHVRENKLYWGKNGENTYPRLKKFLTEMDGGIVPANLWYYKDVGTTDAASKDLENLFGQKMFDFPKSINLIKKMLDISTDTNSIILDFFSGSATTAHAVMQLNAEDGGNRKFIMVQLPEKCATDSEAYKAGYKTICDIGKERIRRAGDKIKAELEKKNENKSDVDANSQLDLTAENTDNSLQSNKLQKLTGGGISIQDKEIRDSLDIGFRVFEVDDSNMKDVYYSAEETSQKMLAGLESNIKDDRTDMDLLYGCLLDWGLPLSLPHTSETIDGVTVHTVNNGDLIACFNADIPESAIRTIAQRKPLRVVFRDSSFATSPEKINVTEIFKTISPTTGVKVI